MNYSNTSAIAAIMTYSSHQLVAVHAHDATTTHIDLGSAYHLRLLGQHGLGSSAKDNSTFADWHEDAAISGY